MALVKTLFSASVAVAALVGATNANATEFVLTGVDTFGSADFGHTCGKDDASDVCSSGSISDEFKFTVPSGVVNAFVRSIALTGKDIILSSVKLDGVSLTQESTGGTELWTLGNTILFGGDHVISVAGTWGTTGGAYSGTLNFAAVPETGTWAMMALGLGLAGAAMRRTRREKLAVSFG
jgi:hypothetical protein